MKATIKVPVCVAFGDRDRITPRVIAVAVAKKFSAKELPYANRAHMLTIELGWENVAQDILSWLRGINDVQMKFSQRPNEKGP